MKQQLELEQAMALLAASAPETVRTTEALPLQSAAGRYLAGDITALAGIPPFARSPYDGYALHSGSVQAASPATPAALPVAGQVYAGEVPAAPLAPGCAMGVSTGAMLPQGADCVIKQEDAARKGDTLYIDKPLAAGENYIAPGEDVPEGALLLRQGCRLDSAALALLALQGLAEAPVYTKPQVTLLSCGDELLPPGAPQQPGKIYDGNRVLLGTRLQSLGAQVVRRWCGDDQAALCACVGQALAQTPLLVSTGGVSVGRRDLLPAVAKALGCEILFHGVAVKPGSPAMAARLGGSLWLALSGNPFAAAAGFELLAGPVVQRLAGSAAPGLQRARGRLANAFGKGGGPRRLVRAHMAGGRVTLPRQGHQNSSLLSLVGCNCLVDVTAGSPPLQTGQEVEVFLLP